MADYTVDIEAEYDDGSSASGSYPFDVNDHKEAQEQAVSQFTGDEIAAGRSNPRRITVTSSRKS